MTIPSRFAIEYAERALQLIEIFESPARDARLLGSFGLLAAAAVLTIPYERMKNANPLFDEAADSDLARKFKELGRGKFLTAPFWKDADPNLWRQGRIMGAVENVDGWRSDDDLPSLCAEANVIEKKTPDDVIRVIRNALAHGNIIYLDKDDREIRHNDMVSMAFISRYEETKDQRDAATTYRVVVTTEDGFLHFIKSWAYWVKGFAEVQTGKVAE